MQKSKWPLIIGISLFLLVVIALCALTVFGTFTFLRRSNVRVSGFTNYDTFAQTQETKSVEAAGITEVVLGSDAGSVTITSSDGTNIEFELVKTAWQEDMEAANQAVAAMQVTFLESAGTLNVDYVRPESITLGAQSENMDKVDFTVRVPAGLTVSIQTDFGDIEAKNFEGVLNLNAGFGKVSAENTTGWLQISNQNGDIVVKNIRAGTEDIDISSSFGSIEFQSVEGAGVRLQTSNGDLTGDTVQADTELRLETEFGAIDLINFDAQSLYARSSNGEIRLNDGTVAGSIEVAGGFQPAVIENVSAESYNVTTQNGNITLTGASGAITLHTEFGEIALTQAEDAVLDLFTGNGKIHFSGTLDPAFGQSLESNFGDIELSIPADVNFNVLLETEFGQIQSDLPVTLQGVLSEKKMTGLLNDGGKLLTVKTQNGIITLSTLAE